jgi:hypothetical protein
MEYLNQFHRESEQRKMKQIAEWRKSPVDLQTALKQQRERERLVKEMEANNNPESTL